VILVPKKWADFQHYKDRCPPWIKLHSDLLNDRVFMRLPLASKALAPLLWLLASESKDGRFDASLDELEFRLRLSKSDIETGLKSLIDNGFFLDASTMLAPCLQVAIPETERETEKEESKQERAKRSHSIDKPSDVEKQTWDDWCQLRKAKKATVTQTVINGARKEAEKAGMRLEEFLQVWCRRGSQGLEASWLRPEERNSAKQHNGMLPGAI
jgi:hypothetical protein